MPCWGPDVDPGCVENEKQAGASTGPIPPRLLYSHYKSDPPNKPRDLAERTDGFSGADLANLLRRAVLHALAETAASEDPSSSSVLESSVAGAGYGRGGQQVWLALRHVEAALAGTRPSTSAAQLARYRAFARRHGQGHGKGAGVG